LRLYELTNAYQNIADIIDLGLPEEEIAKVVETLEGAIEEKAGNIAMLIQNIDADITALKAEEDRLNGRRKALDNRRNWLKFYLEDSFKKAGLDKVKTATHTIALQNNNPSVNIINLELVPKDYQRHIDEWQPDKKLILEAIKSGQAVPGAEIQQTQSIRIR